MSTRLIRNLITAFFGRRLWLKILKSYHLKNRDYVILIPEGNQLDSYMALLYLDRFLEEKNAESAVVISSDEVVLKAACIFSAKVRDVKLINSRRVKELLKFYCLYEFSDRLIVASLREPEGRNGEGLIGKNGLKAYEVFGKIVYNLTDASQVKAPVYNGSDQSLKDFINQYEGMT